MPSNKKNTCGIPHRTAVHHSNQVQRRGGHSSRTRKRISALSPAYPVRWSDSLLSSIALTADTGASSATSSAESFQTLLYVNVTLEGTVSCECPAVVTSDPTAAALRRGEINDADDEGRRLQVALASADGALQATSLECEPIVMPSGGSGSGDADDTSVPHNNESRPATSSVVGGCMVRLAFAPFSPPVGSATLTVSTRRWSDFCNRVTWAARVLAVPPAHAERGAPGGGSTGACEDAGCYVLPRVAPGTGTAAAGDEGGEEVPQSPWATARFARALAGGRGRTE